MSWKPLFEIGWWNAWMLMLFVSVASASWLFFILSMLWMVFPLRQVLSEEQVCLEVFGTQ